MCVVVSNPGIRLKALLLIVITCGAGLGLVSLTSTAPLLVLLLALMIVFRVTVSWQRISVLLVVTIPVVNLIVEGRLGHSAGDWIILMVIALYLGTAAFTRKHASDGSPGLGTLLIFINAYHAWLLVGVLAATPSIPTVSYWAGALVVSNAVIIATAWHNATSTGVSFYVVSAIHWIGTVMSVVGLALIITGPISVLGISFGSFTQWTGLSRGSSLFANPIPMGMLLVFAIPATVAILLEESVPRRKVMWVVSLILLLSALVLTLSKSAWIASSIGAFLVCALWSKRAIRQYLLIVVGTVLIAGTASLLVGDLATVRFVLRADTGLSGREVLWQTAQTIIERRPVLGYGAGAANLMDYGLAGLSTHSSYLRVLVEGGVVGLALYLCILFTAVRCFWHRVRHAADSKDRAATIALFACLCSFSFQQFVETTLFGGSAFYSVFLLICMGTAVSQGGAPYGRLSARAD